MSLQFRAARRRAVTLVELLVVMAILAILAALLLPAVQAAREAARQTQCKNRLRQTALAIHLHHGAAGRYPPGRLFGGYGVGPTSRAWSWLAIVLPQLEQQALYDRVDLERQSLADSGVAHTRLELLLCPSDPYSQRGPRLDAGDLAGLAVGLTNYKAVCGSNWGHDSSQGLTHIGTDWPHRGTNGSWDGQDSGDGAMFRSDHLRRQRDALVRDGLSNTFLLGEVLPEKDRWTSWPYTNNAYATCAIPPNFTAASGNYDPLWWPNVLSFRSAHAGVVGFAMADGSVRLVADQIDLPTYRALATIQGGE